MKINIKYLFIVAGILITFPFILFYPDTIYIQAGAFIVFVLIALYTVRFDLGHPYVWFLPVFTMYALSAPILVELGELQYLDTYSQVILYHYIAAAMYVLFAGPRRYQFKFPETPFRKNSIGVKVVFFICLTGSILYLTFLATSGIESKYDRALMSNPLGFIGFSFYMLTTVISIIIVQQKLNLSKVKIFKGPMKWPILLSATIIMFYVFAFLVSGERHNLFRILLVFIILYHILYKPIRARYLLLILLLGLVISSLAQETKMLLLRTDASFSLERVWLDILYSEFKSSGRNMAILIDYVPYSFPFSNGEFLLSDLIRSVIPGFLFPRFDSTTVWFNQTFFPHFYESGGGVGFSLVGVGYVNFGVWGVIALFALSGYMMRKLYKRATCSVLALIIYINIIPIFLFSVRGDLSTLISQTWKHVLLVVLLIVVINRLTAKNSWQTNRSPDPVSNDSFKLHKAQN